MGLFPGGGGQGLVGVPIFGGSAGGTSSFLTDVSSSIFFVMATLLMELDVAELKGSSLLTFDNVLKSANPSSNDSFPKTEAKGSVAKMNKENQCNRTEKHQISCSLLVSNI